MFVLKINFIPDSDRDDRLRKINKGLKEYKGIWKKDGERIVRVMEKVSELKFRENEINAVVYESHLPSRSFPLSLRAGVSSDIKPGLLIHELCHRIISGNFHKFKRFSLEIHKVLNLILYDILIELYGEDDAKKTVKWESGSSSGRYKEAWNWALEFDKETRRKKFKSFIKKQD